jgi:hypothetical protein
MYKTLPTWAKCGSCKECALRENKARKKVEKNTGKTLEKAPNICTQKNRCANPTRGIDAAP